MASRKNDFPIWQIPSVFSSDSSSFLACAASSAKKIGFEQGQEHIVRQQISHFIREIV